MLVAGSTWPGDETILIPYFNNHRDCKLIIAPHVVTEEHIAQIVSQCQVKVLRYTELENSQPFDWAQGKILIIDCYGLLSSIYNYGIVTHVGGGFDPTGVHNVLEAAVWDRPVVYGPDYTDYQEAIGLHESGGGLVVRDAKEFNAVLDKLFTDPDCLASTSTKSGAYVKSQQGATQKFCQIYSQMVKKYDFLIIGSGVAGMSCALKIARAHKGKIAILCKTTIEEANTAKAQGGIASVTNLLVDDFEKHINDTMIAGDFISDREAVEQVVRNAPEQIMELVQWG